LSSVRRGHNIIPVFHHKKESQVVPYAKNRAAKTEPATVTREMPIAEAPPVWPLGVGVGVLLEPPVVPVPGRGVGEPLPPEVGVLPGAEVEAPEAAGRPVKMEADSNTWQLELAGTRAV
jgi:hypothetical protein